MAGAAIAPSLPAMRAHFADAPGAELMVRLLLTIPALAIAVAAPLSGMIIDRWGRTRILHAGLLLYALAGGSGLVLDSLEALLVGRVLLGIAVAAIMTSVTTLIADYFAGAERARFMGWQASFMGLGGVVFLVGGGLLAEAHWRLPFAVYLVALPLLLLARATLPEPAVTRRVRSGAGSPGAPDATFRGEPGRVLGVLAAAGSIGMLAFYMVPTQLPFLLSALMGASPAQSGIALATSTLFGAGMALFYGRVRRRLSFASVLALNFAGIGAGYLLVGRAGSYAGVLAGLVVCGLGMGLMMPNLNVWLTSVMPESLRGRALGALATALFLGQFLSPLVMQPVIRSVGLGGSFTVAGVLLVGLGLLTAMGRRRIAGYTSPVPSPAAGRARPGAATGAPPPAPFPPAAAIGAGEARSGPPRE